jgi:hypothetical protein
MIKTKNSAIASHLMLEASELKDYRYHYGRTSLPVWSVDNEYYCVTKGAEKPAKHRDGLAWEWEEVSDNWVNHNGYRIWKSK